MLERTKKKKKHVLHIWCDSIPSNMRMPFMRSSGEFLHNQQNKMLASFCFPFVLWQKVKFIFSNVTDIIIMFPIVYIFITVSNSLVSWNFILCLCRNRIEFYEFFHNGYDSYCYFEYAHLLCANIYRIVWKFMELPFEYAA